MFNRDNTFVIPIFSGGKRMVKLRFPTDEQLCQRSRDLRLISRDRPLTETDIQANESAVMEAAQRLVESVREVEGAGESRGEPFDGAEAIHLLNRLLRCEKADDEDIPTEGDEITVSIVVTGNVTVRHSMRIPTKGQTRRWARGQRIYRPANGHQWRIDVLEPHAALYDEVAISCAGYATEKDGAKVDAMQAGSWRALVPITHKHAAVAALINAVDRMESAAEGEHPEG